MDDLIADARSLLRSGKLHKLHKSLLLSAVERAEAGEMSGLVDRLSRTKAVIAKQDADLAAEAEAREAERLRLARCLADRYGSAERVRSEIERIDHWRRTRKADGDVISWGGTHDTTGNVMERRHLLEMAADLLTEASP